MKYAGVLATGFSSYISIKNEIQNNNITKLENIIQKNKDKLTELEEAEKVLESKIGILIEQKNNLAFKTTKVNSFIEQFIEDGSNIIKNSKEIIKNNREAGSNNEGSNLKIIGALEQAKINLTRRFQEMENDKDIQDILESNISHTSKTDSETPTGSDIQQSSFFINILENFEDLNPYQKIAVFLLLNNSILVSSLINIIFIFYGDVLLNKYNIEARFPKLAKIIQLRRKFTKYYFIINCLLIICTILIEIIFGIAVLSI
jgi:hypothetical protein